MKKTFYLALLWSAFFAGAFAQANIKLTDVTLMHEMRATPYPLDKAVVDDRYVSFQWYCFVETRMSPVRYWTEWNGRQKWISRN